MVRHVLPFAVILALVGLVLGPVQQAARSQGAETASPTATVAALPGPPGTWGLSARDIGAPFPDGLALTLLASGRVASPAGATRLRLDRVPIPPGAETDALRAGGPEILYVEGAPLDIVGDSGLAGTYGVGGRALVPPGAVYTVRNTTAVPASLLRLGLISPTDQPAGASDADVLLTADIAGLPARVADLFIARATLAPGAETEPQVFPGPVGLLVESGTVTVEGPDAIPVQLGPGQAVVAPSYRAYRIQNVGDSPASALVVGALPEIRDAAIEPTPTPTPDLLATAEATIAALRAAAEENETALATAEADLVAARATVVAQAEAAEVLAAEALETEAAAEALVAREAALAEALATAEAEMLEAEATIEALETAQTRMEAALTTVGAERMAAETTIRAQAIELTSIAATATAVAEREAAAEATIEAQTVELADIAATATVAAEQAAEDLSAARSEAAATEATVEVLEAAQAEVEAALATAEAEGAEAEATVGALSTRVAEVAETATAEARRAATEAAAAEATIEAQATELAAIAATATAEALQAAEDVIAAEATIEAYATAQARTEAALATAEAEALAAEETVVAMSAEVAAAGQTATAQAEALEAARGTATAAALAAAATIEALEGDLADAEAQTTALAAAIGTADAEITAAEAAVAGLEATVVAREAEIVAAGEEIAAAEATIAVLATRQAEVAQVAQAAIIPEYVEEQIAVDLYGLLVGDPTAEAVAREEVRRVLERYDDECRAGVVLTFGHGADVLEGAALADAVNALLVDEFPEVFEGAAFENFANIDPPLGQVDIRLYFFTGCDPAEEALVAQAAEAVEEAIEG